MPRAAPAIAGLLLLPAACAPVPEPFISAGITVAQAGTAAFLGGEMQASLRHPTTDVRRVCKEALACLALPVEFDEGGEREWTITARDLTGRLLELRIRALSPVLTGLRIKVGTFGDQPLSRLLLDEITQRLGPPPAAQTRRAEA